MTALSSLLDDSAPPLLEAFSCILGNNCRLIRASRCCAWNGFGAAAHEAVEVFKDQARELFSAQDELAFRISALGGFAAPDDREGVVAESYAEIESVRRSPIMLARILERGHGEALLSIEAAAEVAEEFRDRVSQLILVQRMIAHQKHVLALRRLT